VRWTRVTAKARVLPDPVRDRARMFFPARPSGTTMTWMGNGSSIPRRARSRTIGSETPSSANDGDSMAPSAKERDCMVPTFSAVKANRVSGGFSFDPDRRKGGTGEEKPHGATAPPLDQEDTWLGTRCPGSYLARTRVLGTM